MQINYADDVTPGDVAEVVRRWRAAARLGLCIDHVEVPDESYAVLRERYGKDEVGFVAELAKKNGERKLMHQILTAAGVPTETPQGRALCLVARVAILAERSS